MMEALAAIALVFFLVLFLFSQDKKKDKPDPRDLRIGRNADNTYYIYDKANNDVIGTFPDKQTAAQHLKDLKK